MRFRITCAIAVVGTIAVFGIGLSGGVANASVKVVIKSVAFANYGGTALSPTVTVTGSGFGTTAPPVQNSATCGGKDYGAYQLGVIDVTEQGWSVGMDTGSGPDCTGVTITSWSGKKVVFTFNPSVYGSKVDSGDSVVVFVKDAYYTLVLP
jgi:hypothetical protein